MCHDYSHCARETCPKAKTCFRAWLHREDIRIKKAHPEQKMWCTYFMGVKPDENGDCKHYVPTEDWMVKKDEEAGDTEKD